MLNALGLLEVRGLAGAIEAADAMLKAASVRLLRQAVTNPALVTLVIEGDLAACRAALDARAARGGATATRRGCLLSRKEIGRPEEDTGYLLETLLAPEPCPPSAPGPETPAGAATATRRGCLLSRKEIGRPEEDTGYLLETLLAPEPCPPSAPGPETAPAPDAALLAFLGQRKQGYGVSEVAARFDVPVAAVRGWLEGLFARGLLRRHGRRYRPADGGAP